MQRDQKFEREHQEPREHKPNPSELAAQDRANARTEAAEREKTEAEKVEGTDSDPNKKKEKHAKDDDEKPSGRLFPVLLLKNYAPRTKNFEILGHTKPARMTKGAAGEWLEVEPKRWIADEQNPPPVPGVEVPGKIWAGTIIRLPVDEAKGVIEKKIGERADAIPG